MLLMWLDEIFLNFVFSSCNELARSLMTCHIQPWGEEAYTTTSQTSQTFFAYFVYLDFLGFLGKIKKIERSEKKRVGEKWSTLVQNMTR